MSRQILNGWKEISNYIKRSVRTVQRWEARLDLPVYRPALKDRSAVVAFSDELDRWISRASPDAAEQSAVLPGNESHNVGHRSLESMNTMLLDTAELSFRMRLLHEQLGQSLRIFQQEIASRTLPHSASVSPRTLGPVLILRPELNVPAMADPREKIPTHAALHAPVEKAKQN
jgi:hypothetical protein